VKGLHRERRDGSLSQLVLECTGHTASRSSSLIFEASDPPVLNLLTGIDGIAGTK